MRKQTPAPTSAPKKSRWGASATNLNLNSGRRDFHIENIGAFGFQRARDFVFRSRLRKEDHAASATSSADLCALTTGFSRRCDQTIDQRSGDARDVLAAIAPLLAHQLSGA